MKRNTFLGNILCFLGFHKWGKPFGFDLHQSNVIDWKKRCERCGILKKYVKAKPEDYGKPKRKRRFNG